MQFKVAACAQAHSGKHMEDDVKWCSGSDSACDPGHHEALLSRTANRRALFAAPGKAEDGVVFSHLAGSYFIGGTVMLESFIWRRKS